MTVQNSPPPSYDPRNFGAQCDVCPLKKGAFHVGGGKKPVEPEWAHLKGRRAAQVAQGGFTTAIHPIVLVGDFPGAQDAAAGRPYVGGVGAILDGALKVAKVGRDNVMLITYAVLCRTEIPDPSVSGKKKFEPKSFMAWLRKENVKIRKANREAKKAAGKGGAFNPIPEIQNPFACCYPRLAYELNYAEYLVNQARQQMPSVPAPVTANLVVMPMGPFALASVQDKPGKVLPIGKYRGSVLPAPVPEPTP